MSLGYTALTLYAKAVKDNTQVNECDYLLIKLYLQKGKWIGFGHSSQILCPQQNLRTILTGATQVA